LSDDIVNIYDNLYSFLIPLFIIRCQTYLEQTKMKFSKDYRAMNPAKITTTVGLNSMNNSALAFSSGFMLRTELKVKQSGTLNFFIIFFWLMNTLLPAE